MRALVLAAVSGLLLLGCKSEQSTPQNVPPNELERVMAAHGNPDYQKLTAMILAKQPADVDYTKAIAEITPETGLDPWATKVELEKRLVERNAGKPILYNREYVTLAGPLKEGRMQCFSGSLLNLVVQRQKPRSQFDNQQAVMIFTSGHILPGYVVDGRLLGVETTVAGRGRVDFGPTKDLKGPIRVVDAEAFAQMFVFQSEIKDVPKMVDILLKRTASRYAIPLAQTENGIEKGPLTIAANAPMNQSAFGFGQADVPANDIERVERDEVDPSAGLSEAQALAGGAARMAADTSGPGKPAETEGLVRYARRFHGDHSCEIDRMVARELTTNLDFIDRTIGDLERVQPLDYQAALAKSLSKSSPVTATTGATVRCKTDRRMSSGRCDTSFMRSEGSWKMYVLLENNKAKFVDVKIRRFGDETDVTFSFSLEGDHVSVSVRPLGGRTWSLRGFYDGETKMDVNSFCAANPTPTGYNPPSQKGVPLLDTLAR